MVDIALKSEAAWVCAARGRRLADVLLPVHGGNKNKDEEELGQWDGEEATRAGPVLLEQVEDGCPCVLTVCCRPGSSDAISRLLIVSEARTMEVYGETGEYCGTVRGARDDGIQPDSPDRGPFYRKQLVLESPSSAFELKLLSLSGRSSVLVCRVVVGLRSLTPGPARGPGIDMQQVQCLVEEMGTSLSPGAQNLMDMVQFQQKNQTGSLGGFLPLLMGGGGFSALARGVSTVGGAGRTADSTVPVPEPVKSEFPDGPSPAQNGGMSESSTSSTCSSTPDLPLSTVNTTSSESGSPMNPMTPMSHAQLAEMMSHFLKGQALGSGPELLPMLQSVCGQVTQLRLDDAAAVEQEKMLRNASWELDSVMERRLEEMERRLKEHMDRRLDALEQKLDKVLMVALNHCALSGSEGGGGAGGGGAGGGAGPALSPEPPTD